jgi:arylsulfatase A-like enzyme
MRRLVWVFSCVVLLAAAAPAQRALAGSRPNILFVFSDDHACQAISAYGSTLLETPHIDRIAREGALFRRNFCGNALCGPSRATVLTGQHSHANGFMRNGNVFDPARQTFVRLLRSVGYQTAVVGKWHLESEPQGFDYWEVLPGQGQYHNPDFLTPAGRVRHAGHATDVTRSSGSSAATPNGRSC